MDSFRVGVALRLGSLLALLGVAIPVGSALASDNLDSLLGPQSAPSEARAPEESRRIEEDSSRGEPADGAAAKSDAPRTTPAEPVRDSQGDPVSARTSRSPAVIEEIVVTAQKRAENIQDVPFSVSAISGEDIRDRAIQNMNDLSLYTPNVKINNGNVVGFIKIRGLGSGNNKGFEQAVGLIVDGVYLGRVEYLSSALLDLDRVEILRGPQGTLMGKNTIAGALNVATGDPQYEAESDISYSLGDYDRSNLTAIVTGPILSDILAVRVAAQRDRADGFMYNATQDRDELNTDIDTIRGKVRFDGIDALSAVASLEWSELSQRVWGFQVNEATPQTTELYSSFDPRFNDDDTDRTGYFDQNGEAHRRVRTASMLADLDWLGHTFTSVTGWSELDRDDFIDADFGPGPLLTLGTDDVWKQLSQELRVTSPVGYIDYVAGLYFLQTDLDTFSALGLLEDVSFTEEAGRVVFPAEVQDLVAGSFPDVVGPVTADRSNALMSQDAYSIAVFGQGRWSVTPTISLIGGLRLSYEKKKAAMFRDFESTGVVFRQFLAQEEFDVAGSRIERDVSPKVSATWDWTDDLTAYATFARAFKGGGFNAAASKADQFTFEAEDATTYETGLKGTLLGGLVRSNLSLFWTEFENLQVSIYDGTSFVVDNAATARTRGVELDAVGVAAAGLLLTGSAGFTYARYGSFPNAPCQAGVSPPCDLGGRELDRAPEWNAAMGFDWAVPLERLPLLSDVRLPFGFTVGFDTLFQADQFVNTDLDPNEFQGAYWLFNARAGIGPEDGLWRLQVNGRNLTDVLVLAGGADVPTQTGSHMGAYDLPRVVTGELRVRF